LDALVGEIRVRVEDGVQAVVDEVGLEVGVERRGEMVWRLGDLEGRAGLGRSGTAGSLLLRRWKRERRFDMTRAGFEVVRGSWEDGCLAGVERLEDI